MRHPQPDIHPILLVESYQSSKSILHVLGVPFPGVIFSHVSAETVYHISQSPALCLPSSLENIDERNEVPLSRPQRQNHCVWQQITTRNAKYRLAIENN